MMIRCYYNMFVSKTKKILVCDVERSILKQGHKAKHTINKMSLVFFAHHFRDGDKFINIIGDQDVKNSPLPH